MNEEFWEDLQPDEIVIDDGNTLLAVSAAVQGDIEIRHYSGEEEHRIRVYCVFAEDFLRAFFAAWKKAAADRVEFLEVMAGGKIEKIMGYPEGTFDLSAPVDSASRNSSKGRGQVI